MALSPNYGWSEPDNSSLVKNGAADIRTLGDAIDTSVWNVGFGQAGKNRIFNGDFGIWQRGATFNSIATTNFTADRWAINYDGGGTRNITRETFTPGTAPVAGYEGQYFLKWNQTVATSGGTFATLFQRIEDARTFAGQTVTVSFWAKTDTARTTYSASGLTQNFGSGGSPSSSVSTNAASTFSFTTSWARYSFTVALPSVSGKTFGTNNDSYLQLTLRLFNNTTFTLDIWGVQVEYGSKATPFQTATGNIQSELAACQRYYYRQGGDNLYMQMGTGSGYSAANVYFWVRPPVTMRVTPTAIDYSSLAAYDNVTVVTATAAGLDGSLSSKNALMVYTTHSSGITQFRPYTLVTNNSTSGYLGLSAEL